LTQCGKFPLIVFSHGLAGCGVQSIFFTETLTRQGYVVAAPDHQDATLCHVAGTGGTPSTTSEPLILDPQLWTDTTYVDRRDDVETAIRLMSRGMWSDVSDLQEVGVAGHSLGGYTALGVVVGWIILEDARIKVALLFSPYSLPFSIKTMLGNIHVPLTYQGADGDIGITPFLEGPSGRTPSRTCPSTMSSCKAATTSRGRTPCALDTRSFPIACKTFRMLG
jgi:alpha-beta hydrolase superfamily lysophospholipase